MFYTSFTVTDSEARLARITSFRNIYVYMKVVLTLHIYVCYTEIKYSEYLN